MNSKAKALEKTRNHFARKAIGVKTMGQKEKESKKSGYYGAKNFDEHYVPKRYR